MRIGIIGLPNCGKTTIFNVLTGGRASTAGYTGGTFQVNTAVVAVPDERVERLSEMYRPKKTTHARVEYSDIAGLSGAGADDKSRGVKLSGELMGAIANNDALLHVVRAFEDETVPHPFESVEPARDIASLETELILSDLGKIENRLERLTTNLKKGKALPTFEDDQKEFELLSRLKPAVEVGTPLREVELSGDEEKRLRGFQFLTLKPMLIILNLGDEVALENNVGTLKRWKVAPVPGSAKPPRGAGEKFFIEGGAAEAREQAHKKSNMLAVRGRLEMDIAQLEEEDRAIFMKEYKLSELSTGRIIRQSYDLLGRMVFFTVGDDEVRAWEIQRGASALECAGVIHTDLARGFIRAEVVSYDDLMAAGSYAAARAAGKVRLEGRDHTIHDGDVIVVRFNVQ